VGAFYFYFHYESILIDLLKKKKKRNYVPTIDKIEKLFYTNNYILKYNNYILNIKLLFIKNYLSTTV